MYFKAKAGSPIRPINLDKPRDTILAYVTYHGTYIKYSEDDNDKVAMGRIYATYISIKDPSYTTTVGSIRYNDDSRQFSWESANTEILDMMSRHHDGVVSGMITGDRE